MMGQPPHGKIILKRKTRKFTDSSDLHWDIITGFYEQGNKSFIHVSTEYLKFV